MTPFALAAAFALAQVLAFAPFAWWPLAYLSFVPLVRLALARGPAARRRLRAAYAGGVILFGGGCAWLAETSWVNLVLMTAAEALAIVLVVLALRLLVRGWPRMPLPLSVPLAWSAVETLRVHWPFNGFPWLQLGATTAAWTGSGGAPPFAQAAEWIGEGGLGAVVALGGGLLASADRAFAARRPRRGLAALALACAVPAGLFLYGSSRVDALGSDARPGPRVALVQAAIPQQLKHEPKSEAEVFDRQRAVTRAALESEPDIDLVCWAETMFPFPLGRGAPDDVWFRRGDERYGPPEADEAERIAFGRALYQPLLEPRRTAFLTGVITHRGHAPEERRNFNSARLYGRDGRLAGEYSKTVLVPGGEFIPLRSILPGAIDAFVRSVAGFLPALSPGDGPTLFTLAGRDGAAETRFAVTICYENAYAGYHARVAALEPDFVVNISNEGWFGASSEFDQMDAVTRLRAIEARTPLVRGTNTGISAFYDVTGRRVATLRGPEGADRAVEGFLVARVPLRGRSLEGSGSTVFVRSRNRPVGLLALVTALVCAVGVWRAVRARADAQNVLPEPG